MFELHSSIVTGEHSNNSWFIYSSSLSFSVEVEEQDWGDSGSKSQKVLSSFSVGDWAFKELYISSYSVSSSRISKGSVPYMQLLLLDSTIGSNNETCSILLLQTFYEMFFKIKICTHSTIF